MVCILDSMQIALLASSLSCFLTAAISRSIEPADTANRQYNAAAAVAMWCSRTLQDPTPELHSRQTRQGHADELQYPCMRIDMLRHLLAGPCKGNRMLTAAGKRADVSAASEGALESVHLLKLLLEGRWRRTLGGRQDASCCSSGGCRAWRRTCSCMAATVMPG